MRPRNLLDTFDISPRDFCFVVVRKAASLGHDGFDRETFDTDTVFLKLLNRLHIEWKSAKASGEKKRARALLRLIDKLGPSTGTGQFDEFKTHIRSLQPGSLSVLNPLYEDFQTPDTAEQNDQISEAWSGLVEDSADILLQHAGMS